VLTQILSDKLNIDRDNRSLIGHFLRGRWKYRI